MLRGTVILCVYCVLGSAYGFQSSRATGHRLPAFQVPDTLGDLGGGMLDVYQIYVHAPDSFTKITALVVSFEGEFAQVQRDIFGTHLPTPLLSDLDGFDPAFIAQDTHFAASLIVLGSPIPPPTEGMITPPLGFDGSGLARDLNSSQVGIAGPDQAPTVLVAQIVFPAGTVNGTFDGLFAVAGNAGQSFSFCGTFGVPEPNSAVYALLSTLLYATHRRQFFDCPGGL